ncbi:type II secretion system protein [Solibacillus sp. FSL R5-0449]|uniref:PilW family protein n=1 Tax=Solibacillus sp. FSL R5-0449 TaxID=2921639 RepID=UPI0030CAE053
MRSIQSQRGLSLVEVLGVIAISSFVIITISSLLVSAMSTSNKQSTKSQLQQQANYILVVWRECQESGLRYTINQESPSRITFNTFEESGTTRCSQVIENVNFQYVLTLPDEDGTTVIESEEFNPKYIKYIPVEIQVKDSKNIQKPYKITTILSRL